MALASQGILLAPGGGEEQKSKAHKFFRATSGLTLRKSGSQLEGAGKSMQTLSQKAWVQIAASSLVSHATSCPSYSINWREQELSPSEMMPGLKALMSEKSLQQSRPELAAMQRVCFNYLLACNFTPKNASKALELFIKCAYKGIHCRVV